MPFQSKILYGQCTRHLSALPFRVSSGGHVSGRPTGISLDGCCWQLERHTHLTGFDNYIFPLPPDVGHSREKQKGRKTRLVIVMEHSSHTRGALEASKVRRSRPRAQARAGATARDGRRGQPPPGMVNHFSINDPL